MVADGIYYALAFAAGGGLVSHLSRPLYGLPFYILAAFCLWFFRDPERLIPAGAVAVSPADGKVVSITKVSPGEIRISIFLNIFDVHVTRSPIGGTIADVQYQPGKFLVASRPEASTENEQNTVVVQGSGTKVVFRQIAGLIARRIVFHKKPGDIVAAGERVGMIKFGSRVDVFLGPEWQIRVREGERVMAGTTVLALMPDSPEPVLAAADKKVAPERLQPGWAG